MAGRSKEKAQIVIAKIKDLDHDASTGEVHFLLLVLDIGARSSPPLKLLRARSEDSTSSLIMRVLTPAQRAV
jgi:hypothetical protein